MFLPRALDQVKRPPIKCQGIKTRLAPFIARSVGWDGRGRWIEPFLGSGSVLFNLAPERALAADSNRHIVAFYRNVQLGLLHEDLVRDRLERMGALLEHGGRAYYEEVRAAFNRAGLTGPGSVESSLLFLFLNRSCFNGVMRFNSRGEFNVPFGHKPGRFRKAYITRIVRQIGWARSVMSARDWRFETADWRETLSRAGRGDFVYADPPYAGRHNGYYNRWSEAEAEHLAQAVKELPCGFAVSMWKENGYRRNAHLERAWNGLALRTFSHFYHVGSREELRNPMTEALVIRPGFEAEG